eukprot:6577754-Lingulodinium_polyedra.AAC.1
MHLAAEALAAPLRVVARDCLGRLLRTYSAAARMHIRKKSRDCRNSVFGYCITAIKMKVGLEID